LRPAVVAAGLYLADFAIVTLVAVNQGLELKLGGRGDPCAEAYPVIGFADTS
jgi:hypothetical protein